MPLCQAGPTWRELPFPVCRAGPVVKAGGPAEEGHLCSLGIGQEYWKHLLRGAHTYPTRTVSPTTLLRRQRPLPVFETAPPPPRWNVCCCRFRFGAQCVASLSVPWGTVAEEDPCGAKRGTSLLGQRRATSTSCGLDASPGRTMGRLETRTGARESVRVFLMPCSSSHTRLLLQLLPGWSGPGGISSTQDTSLRLQRPSQNSWRRASRPAVLGGRWRCWMQGAGRATTSDAYGR